MTTTLASANWPACLSALRLDRWMAGELGAGEAEVVQAHLAGCARCTDAAQSLRAARDGVALPPLRSVPVPARRSTRLRGFAAAAAGLAVVAGVVLLRPHVPADRTKGTGVGFVMYVRHGDDVRRAGPGEAVAPGDAVRFAVTTPEPAWVAVLSVDPVGRASVYFPDGTHAARIEPGADVPLPLATRLDATEGEERVLGLFCDRPIELEPVRAALEAGAGGAVPEGCQVTRWSFVKR